MRVLYSRVGLGVGRAACWARLLQACCEAQCNTIYIIQDNASSAGPRDAVRVYGLSRQRGQADCRTAVSQLTLISEADRKRWLKT